MDEKRSILIGPIGGRAQPDVLVASKFGTRRSKRRSGERNNQFNMESQITQSELKNFKTCLPFFLPKHLWSIDCHSRHPWSVLAHKNPYFFFQPSSRSLKCLYRKLKLHLVRVLDFLLHQSDRRPSGCNQMFFEMRWQGPRTNSSNSPLTRSPWTRHTHKKFKSLNYRLILQTVMLFLTQGGFYEFIGPSNFSA